MIKKLTCIICPRGCELTAEIKRDNIEVKGNICPKGKIYAIDECVHPVRTVTSTVRISNRDHVMVSVKTTIPIPKEKIFEAIKEIRKINVKAPVTVGDVLLSNIFGADIVATKTVL